MTIKIIFQTIILWTLMSSFNAIEPKSLYGTWVTVHPIDLGGSKIAGFDIDEPKKGFKENEWNSEGGMYDHLTNGARTYPSSFDYFIEGNILKIRITFSVALLEEGEEFVFKIKMLDKAMLELEYDNQKSIYTKQLE